MNKKVSNAV